MTTGGFSARVEGALFGILERVSGFRLSVSECSLSAGFSLVSQVRIPAGISEIHYRILEPRGASASWGGGVVCFHSRTHGVE